MTSRMTTTITITDHNSSSSNSDGKKWSVTLFSADELWRRFYLRRSKLQIGNLSWAVLLVIGLHVLKCLLQEQSQRKSTRKVQQITWKTIMNISGSREIWAQTFKFRQRKTSTGTAGNEREDTPTKLVLDGLVLIKSILSLVKRPTVILSAAP